ncbi:MAG TPA: CHASE sensor domain-containing protein, partial [Thermoanaerobaculia bacterium]|nr:CHASE sensor domain-containing protein [Thermoanaerobaculia bacterium]
MSGERQAVRPSGLTPAHALTAAVVLLVAGIVASMYQDRLFRAQRAHELTVQGEIVAANVTAALVFGDVKAVQEHVAALGIDPAVAAAAVYDSSGNRIASFVRVNAEPLPGSLRNAPLNAGSPTLLINVPVTHQSETLGTVLIRATGEPLSRLLTRHAAMMLLAIMAALLMA